MTDLIGDSLTIMLGGDEGPTPPEPENISLTYILENGYPVFDGAQPAGYDTELETVLADYTINIYAVISTEKRATSINHVYGSFGTAPDAYKGDYVYQQDTPIRYFCVYYADNVPVCAQELSASMDANRNRKAYTAYKWGLPLSEYGKPQPAYTDWDYEVCITSDTEIDTTALGTGRYVPRTTYISQSSGNMSITIKDLSYPTDSPSFVFTKKTYYYTMSPMPELSNIVTSSISVNPYINFIFPCAFDADVVYELVKSDDITVSALQQIFLDISAKIFQYYYNS